MKPEVYTLSNGLRVILVDTKTFPSLTTLLLVGAGSRYENEKNNGVAHFFEHMAFKGSKKYPNSFIITSTIEGLGGIVNAFTGKDHTGYWIKATNEHFKTAVDVLADMVQNPLLKEEEMEREKGVIVEEINMLEDMPQQKVGDLFERLLYQANPLGFEVSGKKEVVKTFQKHTFDDYRHHFYQPRNAVLVVAGGLVGNRHACSLQDYLKIIEKKFSSWQNGKMGEFKKVSEKQLHPQILLKYKKTEQTHFCLGFRAFSFNDPRKYALSLLSTILGGGMSSRLFIEVRERRGLCYYISTGRELYHDCGNMVTQAGVANNLDKIKKAIEVILKEHGKMKKLEVGNLSRAKSRDWKLEIKKAKEMLKGRLLLSMEDSFNVASFFGTKKLLQDKTETPQETIKNLEKVTADDIVSVACDILKPKNLNIALIGPFERKEVGESFGNITI
jgi:predicted Zn-dependent peptidase